MERGDLALSTRPYYVVVLEGVLCQITALTHERRFRAPKTVGFNLVWMDLPMRRLATKKRQFPEVGAEIVTFISEETADFAADFLDGWCHPLRLTAVITDFDHVGIAAAVPRRAASRLRLRPRPTRPLRPDGQGGGARGGLHLMDIQKALLSKLIHEQAASPTWSTARITPEFFTDEQYRRIYEYLIEHWRKYGQPADLDVMTHAFPSYDLAEPHPQSLDFFIDGLRERRKRSIVTDT